MLLPSVARRSPAMITPSMYLMATIVVPWVVSIGVRVEGNAGSLPVRRNKSEKLGPGSCPGPNTGIVIEGAGYRNP
jgi:hypothetical protein